MFVNLTDKIFIKTERTIIYSDMNSIISFFKGLVSGIFVLLFWPIMITIMLGAKYIINPFYGYVVNPLKSLFSKFAGK